MTPESFLKITNLLDQPILLLEANGNLVSANQSALDLLGYVRSELREITFFDLIDSSSDLVRDYLKLCSRTRNPVLGAFDFKTKMKQVISCRTDGGLIEPATDSKPSCIQISLKPKLSALERFKLLDRELQVQKLTGELEIHRHELQVHQERLKFALESAKLASWEWDIPSDQIWFSDTFFPLLGLHPTQKLWTSKEFLDHIHPDDRKQVENQVNEILTTTRTDMEIEYRVLWADQSVRWLYGKGSLHLDSTGSPLWLAGVIMDITRLKSAESALQQALSARDEFLSICSHELKTPITSIKLQIQSKQRARAKGSPEAYSPDQIDRLLEKTNKQMTRLERLVDDMLDISRIRTGKLVLEKRKLDLCELTSEVVEGLKSELISASEGITPRLELCGSAYGEWDRLRIEQVLINLLTNAIRYGNRKPVDIFVQKSGQKVQLRVRDYGIGISKEHQERIFNRFERAISANEISGLGLGLFISRQIVHAHGGRIWVESQERYGSTFIVELPADDQIEDQHGVTPKSDLTS